MSHRAGLITNRTNENGHTIIEATLEPGKPRDMVPPERLPRPFAQREVRFLSDTNPGSVGDSQLRITALCDVAVIQGEAAEFRRPLPPGYELTEVNAARWMPSETTPAFWF